MCHLFGVEIQPMIKLVVVEEVVALALFCSFSPSCSGLALNEGLPFVWVFQLLELGIERLKCRYPTLLNIRKKLNKTNSPRIFGLGCLKAVCILPSVLKTECVRILCDQRTNLPCV
jgi:hypothetical protein